MKPKIIKKPEIKLAGFISRTKELSDAYLSGLTIKDITSNFWKDCLNNGNLRKLNKETFIKNHNQYGVYVPGNPEFEYIIGIETKKGCTIPEKYHVYTIPEASYAVFKTTTTDKKSFSTAIDNTYLAIYFEWLPTSGYIYLENKPNFCFYDSRYNNDKSNVCEIYIPVEKKRSTTSSEHRNVETKKCLNCLRRIAINYNRCPYCRSDNFDFDL